MCVVIRYTAPSSMMHEVLEADMAFDVLAEVLYLSVSHFLSISVSLSGSRSLVRSAVCLLLSVSICLFFHNFER